MTLWSRRPSLEQKHEFGSRLVPKHSTSLVTQTSRFKMDEQEQHVRQDHPELTVGSLFGSPIADTIDQELSVNLQTTWKALWNASILTTVSG